MSVFASELRSRDELENVMSSHEQGTDTTQSKNVFEEIELEGDDEDFEPRITSEFIATSFPAGSLQKQKVLQWRVEKGFPLWHDDDRVDYRGIHANVRAAIVPEANEIPVVLVDARANQGDDGTAVEESANIEVPHTGRQHHALETYNTKDVEPLAREELNRRLAKKRAELSSSTPSGSAPSPQSSKRPTVRDIILRERAALLKAGVAMPRDTFQGIVNQKRTPPETLPLEGQEARKPNEASSSAEERGPLEALRLPEGEEQRVLRMFLMLKEARDSGGILPSALTEFTNQHRNLLSVLVPGEVSAAG